jgi:RNA-directed DNA polymerase
LELRVEEVGKSECRPVIRRIRVEPYGNITRPEREQTSKWSLSAKEPVEPDKKGEKQMTTKVGAVSGGADVNWQQIDWQKAHCIVRRLQVRIAEATRQGRWNKVKALQWIRTHSFYAKALAVKRVTENQGKRTPGVDRVVWSTPKDKAKAILSLRRRGYRPLPLSRTYVPKANGKKRPLGIPTMKDRAIQALYLLALEPVAETLADKNSYGFR